MIVRHLAIVTALCCACSLSAQTDKVKVKARVDPEAQAAKDLVPKSVMTTNDGRTILVFKDRSPHLDESTAAKVEPLLELYDSKKINLIRTLPPFEKSGKQQVHLENVVQFNGEPVMFATIRDLSKGQLSVVRQAVDQNLVRAGRTYEPVLTFNTDPMAAHVTMGKPPGSTSLQVEVAPGGSTALIATPELRDTVAGKGTYMFAALGEDLLPKWQHVVKVEEGVHRSHLVNMQVDDEGNAWLLFRYENQPKGAASKSKGGNGNGVATEMKLFHIDANGIRGIRFGLDKDQYVTSALLKRKPGGGSICAGRAISTAEGDDRILYFIADVPEMAQDLEAPRTVKDPISAEGPDGAQPELRDVHIASNGDMFLVVEEYTYASIPHPKTLKHSMKHVHGPVHVLNVGRSGNLNWKSSIRRLLHTDTEYFGNVHSVLFDDQITLLMLDSDKNAEKRGDMEKGLSPADMNKPYTTQFTLLSNGTYKPKTLLQSGTSAYLIAGEELFPLGNDQYLGFVMEKFEDGAYLPVMVEFSR